MSVIIRLQGLSWSASAMDIRNFFKGLSIPPGGVRIIGGDNGDAFIAFSTDEDARQAMMLTNKPLNDSPVQLFLSSKTEMQNTISQAKDKPPSVSAPDQMSINSGKTVVSPQIPSVQEISRAFPAVGQIMGTLGIQPSTSVQINQFESGMQNKISHGAQQQPSGLFGFVNNQPQSIQSNVKKQMERDLPGEYSVGGFQGINKQAEIKPNMLGHSGLSTVESFHNNEYGKVVSSVQNNFNNPRPHDNFQGEVYFPPKNDIPFNNQIKGSSGHNRSYQNDQPNLDRNLGGHGEQLQIVQQFSNFNPNDNRFGHPNFQQGNRQWDSNLPSRDMTVQGGNMPVDPYFPPGNKANDPYIPPNSSYKNPLSKLTEPIFSQRIADSQLNANVSVGHIPQNFHASSNQGNSKLSATNLSYAPSSTSSGTLEKSELPSRTRQSRFSQANATTNRPIDSFSQPKDQSIASSLAGPVVSKSSARENKTDQGRSLGFGKATESLVLSNKQDEFGRNVPYSGHDSPTQDKKLEESRVRDKADSHPRMSNRRDSRERDKSRDRSGRRDSPRDRRERDRDRSRRDRDDDRRSRRDRDRDYDRKPRDRDSERNERNRDRDVKRSPSVGSSRKARKRSLSPKDNHKNEKDKKLQTERPGQNMKVSAVNQEATETKSERSPMPTNYDSYSRKDTEQKNSNSMQALFPIIPTSISGKGILGEAPAGITSFKNNISHGTPLLETPMVSMTNVVRRDDLNPVSGIREDRMTQSMGDGIRQENRFGARGERSEEYERSYQSQHNYRDPYYSSDENFDRNRQSEELRRPRFFDRNQHDMEDHLIHDGSFMKRDRERQEGSFMQRDREYRDNSFVQRDRELQNNSFIQRDREHFDDRRPPEFKEINRGPEGDFHPNKANFPHLNERNRDVQTRPSLLGDGGVQNEMRDRHGPDSEFRRSRNEMPSLFDDIQNPRRNEFQGRGRGLQSHRGGHENVFRNNPSFDHLHENPFRDDQNGFNHPRDSDPNFYESNRQGPPRVLEPFRQHGMDDEYFNPEHADMRNNMQSFRGRGMRGHGFPSMPFNMRGTNIGPPGHREFQGDREKGEMQERISGFSNIEKPFNIDGGDTDRRDRYDNRSSERHQHQSVMDDRSSERVRKERNFERNINRVESDQSLYVAGKSKDMDRNKNVQGSVSESSSSREQKPNVEKKEDIKAQIHPTENNDMKTKLEKENETLKGNALCSVVLENIPIETTYKDIRKLFSGLEVPKDGIKIINNNEGKRIGKAFVKFGSQESFKKGLQRDRTRLQNKIIIIKPVQRKEFDNAIDSYLPPDDDDEGIPDIDMCNSLSATLRALKGEPVLKVQKRSSSSQNDYVVKITLLPEYAKIQNIKSYFKDGFAISKSADAIVIESSRFKACTGLCYVEFADETSFKKALNLKRMFERKAIKIEKGSMKEMDELRDKMKNSSVIYKDTCSHEKETTNKNNMEVQKKVCDNKSVSIKASDSNSEQSKTSSANNLPPSHICLRVRNIPRSFKVFELRTLFEGVSASVKVAQICHDAVGKAIGEGYLEFTTNEDVQKCLVKNGTYINKNKITVEPVTKPEMIENMRLLRQSLQPETPTTQAVFFFVKAENLPKNVSTGEIMNFFSGYNPAPESIRLNINENKDQPNCSTALVGFRTRDQAETAIRATNGNLLRSQAIKLTKVQ